MAADTFDTIAFPFTIGHEGAWGNDPKDRGNWTSGVVGKGELKGTKYGIAAHVYPFLDIKNLSLAQAKEIYKSDYAAKVSYVAQPAGVDISVWDMAVNAGVTRSLSLLKSSLGSAVTTAPGLAAVASASPDKVALIKKFSGRRLSFYQGLKTFTRYGKGWTRRAAECEALSVKTWLTLGEKQKPAEVKKNLEAEQKKAESTATNHATGGLTTGGAEGLNAAQHTWQFDWLTAAEIGVAVIAVGFVVYFTWKALAHRQRALAYAEMAKL